MVTPRCANVLFKSRRGFRPSVSTHLLELHQSKPLKIHSGLICGAESALVEIVGVEERQRCVETKKCEARQPRCARPAPALSPPPDQAKPPSASAPIPSSIVRPRICEQRSAKKKCRRRPAAAAPPSRPVQVCLRQSSLESAPASRAREDSEYGQRFFQTTNRSIGRSLELPHRPPPAPTTSSPPRNQKRNRPLSRQGQISTALGSASRARETTQSTLRRLATDAQKLDQLSGLRNRSTIRGLATACYTVASVSGIANP